MTNTLLRRRRKRAGEMMVVGDVARLPGPSTTGTMCVPSESAFSSSPLRPPCLALARDLAHAERHLGRPQIGDGRGVQDGVAREMDHRGAAAEDVANAVINARRVMKKPASARDLTPAANHDSIRASAPPPTIETSRPMRPERYNVRESEPKWQKIWAERDVFATPNDDPRPSYYVLEMFPYPSGRIHMGHVRNYAMGDVVARYKRARGFNVLHPMGWDAFGMPAENAAMQNKTHPATWTYANIDAMRGAAEVDGPVARLVARGRDLRSQLLQASAEAVPRFPRRRPRRAQEIEGQLGPGRPDRARQRAGDRRARLALRRDRRAARTHAMVLQDLRLFRGTAGGARQRSTAGRKKCG